MATVQFEFHSDLAASLKYVTQERGDDDVVSSLNCDAEDALEQFRNTKRLHDKTGGKQAFVLIQSFPPKERGLKTPEEFHDLGKKLAERLFPGFEAVIRTHTDKGHIHNHIVVNTIHAETGVRITNEKQWGQFFGPPKRPGALDMPEVAAFVAVYRESKKHENYQKKMLHWLRRENDQIVREAGLSVIERQAHEREASVPKKVMRMEQFKKDSWVLDLMQKANHARAYATSYDEFQGVMREMFQIEVRVEKKNIVYAYPGQQKRVIRGKRLGRNFDKEGLERNFANNDRMFAARPGLRAELRAGLDTLSSHQGGIVRDSSGVLLEPGGARTIFTKDYGAFTASAHPGRSRVRYSEPDPDRGIIPIDEIQKAKGSIFDYCAKNKIGLEKNEKGETVLKGRRHVVVTDREFLNTKSNIAGSLIDFVAIHQQLTYVRALAKINGNPRLLLLEQYWGERKRSFNAFYIPKQEQMERGPGTAALTRLFQSFGAGGKAASGLLERNQAQVCKSGAIRIFAESDESGALEFIEEDGGKWKERKVGKARGPFYRGAQKGRTVHVFGEARDFLVRHGEEAFGGSKRLHGVLALLSPDPEPLDHYLNEHQRISKVVLITPKKEMSKADLDFFGILKARYQHLGIEIEHAGRGQELSRGGPEIDL